MGQYNIKVKILEKKKINFHTFPWRVQPVLLLTNRITALGIVIGLLQNGVVFLQLGLYKHLTIYRSIQR